MTFPAKQWAAQQLVDLADKVANKLARKSWPDQGAMRRAVHDTIQLLFSENVSDTLRVLGSDGACHGTVHGYVSWGCRCDPCEDAWEREQARLERTSERKSA